MSDYGITNNGFVLKPLQDILSDKGALAQQMFGDDVDLRSTSSLRKLLDISSAEDLDLWKGMESLFYSNFQSTASGVALDLLGDDVGVARAFLPASGRVQFKLSNESPGRTYQVPLGTIVETGAPVQRFRTLQRVTLSSASKVAFADVESAEPGPVGNVIAAAINTINAAYAARYLNLGAAVIAVTNPQATSGGDIQEDDESYRAQLIGRPRTLWTLEAVRAAAKNIDGVRDCRLFDPYGGVDVSLSKFNLFVFNRRRFGTQPPLGSPFFFDVLVAVFPGFEWESNPPLVGVKDLISAAIDPVRPISIFPNLRLANNVLIGIRANILSKPGHDANAIAASIKQKLEARVAALGLGSSVLYSQVMCDCKEVPGVVDVQQLHLRRCPPLMGGITFGRSERFSGTVIEAAVGENIPLLPDEIAVFQVDSQLLDIQVSDT